MQSLLSHILDFLFPPTKEALVLRALSADEMGSRFQKPEPPHFPFITSLFSYKDPLVKEFILNIKSRKDVHSLTCAGELLYKRLEEYPDAILIPIPISQKRRRERGFNQCELLIDEVMKLDSGKRFEKRFDILSRAKHTIEQKLKNREERLSTLGIFSVVAAPISKPIILIDDVSTTGSTLNEARNTLLQAGYADILALTLAH